MTTLKQIIDTVDETVSLEQIKSFIPNEEAYKNAAPIELYYEILDTPLEYAISRGRTALVAYFFDQCQADINQKGRNSRTPIICAADAGHTNLVAMFVARGAELDATDDAGETALHYAALYDYIESIRLLLDAGADIEARTKYDGFTPLHSVASHGHIESMHLLLDAGADIEARTKNNGSTPLILAARNGHVNVITALAARGAHLDVRDNMHQTALGSAAANRQLEAFKMLLALGAPVQDLNPTGFSPEMAAEWAKACRTDTLYNGSIRGIHNLEDINQERFKCFYSKNGLTERLMRHIDTLGETDLGKFLNAMMPPGGLLHLAHPGSFPSSAPHSLMSASEQNDSLLQETGKKRFREDQSPPDTILEGGSVVQKRPALGQPTLSGLHASALTSKNASYPNK